MFLEIIVKGISAIGIFIITIYLSTTNLPTGTKVIIWIICGVVSLAFFVAIIIDVRKRKTPKPELKLGIIDKNKFSDTLIIKLISSPKFVSIEEIINEEKKKIEEELKKIREKGNANLEVEVKEKTEIEGIELAWEDYIRKNVSIEEYQELVNKSFKNIKEYFRNYYEYLDEMHRIYKVTFCLENSGNSPAKNIGVRINYPKVLKIRGKESFPHRPSLVFFPIRDKRSHLAFKNIVEFEKNDEQEIKAYAVNLSFQFPSRGKFIAWNELYGLIEANEDKLKHFDKVFLEFYIEFYKEITKGCESSKNLEFEYEIIADNIKDKITGKIPIKMENEI